MRNSTKEELDMINSITENKLSIAAMYSATVSKLKSKGSNYTPPKKKRKR